MSRHHTISDQDNIKSHYQILEIDQHATTDQIRKAYKKLTLQYHPDRAEQNNIDIHVARDKIKGINSAYEVLSNPEKKQSYDLTLTAQSEKKSSRTHYAKPYDFFTPKKKKKESVLVEPSDLNPTLSEIFSTDQTEDLNDYLLENKKSINQKYLQTLLYHACWFGKYRIAQFMLENLRVSPKFFVDSYAFSGCIFKAAARSGYLPLVQYLLETHHLDIESQNPFEFGRHETALSLAVSKGHEHIVTYLIAKGASVHPKIDYSDILSEAIHSNNFNIFKLLCESGANIKDSHLEFALGRGNLQTVQYLLEKKPGLFNIQYQFNSPTLYAVSSGNVRLVQYLEQNEGLDLYKPYEYNYSLRNKDIHISLIKAATRSGNIDMMKYVLEEKNLLGRCVDSVDRQSMFHAALSTAARAEDSDSNPDVISNCIALVRYLMEEQKFMLPHEEFKRLIIKHGEFSSIRMNAYLQSYFPELKEHQVIMHQVADKGLSALTLYQLFELFNLNIIKKGSYHHYEREIGREVRSRQIPTETIMRDISQNKPFLTHAAFYYMDINAYEDFNTDQDYKNMTLLKFALSQGLDINATNPQGLTLLENAVKQGHYDHIAQYLIEEKADVYRKNQTTGKSVYDNLKYLPEFLDQLYNVEQRSSCHCKR